MELPVRTGPGTPGGNLLRRYWQPIAISRFLAPGSPPQAIRILGEDLVLFRDENGNPGLLALRCAHRQADLSYGRIENGGLRCIYHGWLWDVAGRCLEQPAEPEKGKHREAVRQKSYPLIERGGGIWAYMGPGKAPVFPDYPALAVPDEHRFTWRWHSACNYLQGNEGNIDPVHLSYLHGFDPSLAKQDGALRTAVSQSIFSADLAPKLAVRETHFGLRLFSERHIPQRQLRITNLIMPNGCAIGGSEQQFGRGGHSMFWHVPIDDESHWRFEFIFHSKAKIPREEFEAHYRQEADEHGIPHRRAENRFLQDRAMMARSYIGMGRVFPAHDLFVTESMGAIVDRDAEHLAGSDVAIARARRMLSQASADVAAGKDPVGVNRDPAKNDYRDLLVISETVDESAELDDIASSLAAQDIYQIKPAGKAA
jgi:phthalate 4,5-dioxygenase oxygenase subunit